MNFNRSIACSVFSSLSEVINSITKFKLKRRFLENRLFKSLTKPLFSVAPNWVQPAQLFDDEVMVASAFMPGWGYSSTEPFERDDFLRSTQLSVIDDDTCRRLLGEREHILTPSHFCVTHLANTSSICNGDLGGPFFQTLQTGRRVIGVGSILTYMCRPGFPTLLTRVSLYLDWITREMELIMSLC